MKRFVVTFLIILILLITGSSYAVYSRVELDFKTINNSKNEDFDLYILLPEEYIKFVMVNSALDIKYDGINTLKNNVIPGIYVDKEDIQDEFYTENGTNYVQILLDQNEEDGIVKFDIYEEYAKLNMKYRIKNEKKDYIVHIDNFKIEDRKCEIEYNYDEDIVKQPDKVMTNTAIIFIIILIIVGIIGLIAYVKQEREN